jgi:predicted transcriptional regulator
MASKNLPTSPLSEKSLSHDVLISAAAQIVSAYIANRQQQNIDLTQLTSTVYQTLLHESMNTEKALNSSNLTKNVKVNIEDSVKPDYLICLEDGKRVKMLKRYLKTNFGMSPEEYRNRWNLPESYPMVAPNYAKVRSQLAKKIGLGRRGMPIAARNMQKPHVAA